MSTICIIYWSYLHLYITCIGYGITTKIDTIEYTTPLTSLTDQEIPQSYTPDQPTAP